MHRDHAHFFAARIEHIRRLFSDIADRAHADHDTFRVGRAVVIEKLIITARDFIDLAHVFLDDFRNRLVVAVGRFAILEVNIRILRRAARHRSIRAQRPRPKRGECFLIDQARQHFLIEHLNFLDFMTGAETVKEIDERQTALQRG